MYVKVRRDAMRWERVIKAKMELVPDTEQTYRPNAGTRVSIVLVGEGFNAEQTSAGVEGAPSGVADEITLDISQADFLIAHVTREGRSDPVNRRGKYTHYIPWEKIADLIFEDYGLPGNLVHM